MPRQKMNLEAVRKLVLVLPDVEENTTPRGTGWKVGGRLLACQAIHKSAEPNSLMVRVPPELRAHLLAENPDAYYVTDHYSKHPAVLVRLSHISRDSLRDLLDFAWEFVSAKTRKAGKGAK
jgi:hypothetical protein